MIVLDATTKTLQALLAGAVATAQLPIVASFVDVTTDAYTPACTDTQTNGATAVTAVASPAAATQRQVKLLTVYNADTAAVTLTIRLNNNATLRILCKVTLPVGATLVYTDGEGFRVIDANGQVLSGSATSMLPAVHELGGSRSVSAESSGTTSVTPRLKNITNGPATTVWTGDPCTADGAAYDGADQRQSAEITLDDGANEYRLVLVDSAGVEWTVPEWEDALIDSADVPSDVTVRVRTEQRLLGEQMFGKGRIELVKE